MTTSLIFSKSKFLNLFHSLFLVALCCMTADKLQAQSPDSLHTLQGHHTQVFYSDGAAAKAVRMADQLDKVISFYQVKLGFSPGVKLLILSPSDWNKYSRAVVYGMPHYTDDKTLIVASENNEFWKSFIPPLEKLPKEYAELITKTYSDKNDSISMEPFFDLLAIHELGHAYHKQHGLHMQRSWMGEVFANIFLHTYIAEKEPGLLSALTVFPKMVVSGTDRSMLKYTSLKDLETFYNEIAQKFPKNYGWYQCRWHMEAGGVYNKGGIAVIQKLWSILEKQKDILNDEALSVLLAKNVHQSMADILVKWDDL